MSELIGGPHDGREVEMSVFRSNVVDFPVYSKLEHWYDSPWANYPSGWYPVIDSARYRKGDDGRWKFAGIIRMLDAGTKVRVRSEGR